MATANPHETDGEDEALSLLRALFDRCPDSVAVSVALRICYVNRACANLFGYEGPSDLVGKLAFDLISPRALEMVGELARGRGVQRKVPARYVTRGLRQDGSEFDVEIRQMMSVLDGTYDVVVHRDVTDEQLGAELSGLGETFYRAVFDVNTAIKLLIDPSSGRILDANQTAIEFYGWPLEELRAMRIADINTLTDAEVREEIQNAVSGKRGYFRFRHRVANGDVRFVEVHSGPIDLGERQLLLSIIHDVTERDALERHLRTSQRLEAVGHLAGGIAHEFNNLLTVLLNVSAIMLRNIAEGSPLRQQVEDLSFASRRAADLTRELLAFSRRQLMQPRRLDLNEVVTEMSGVLRRTFGEGLEVDTALTPGLASTHVDPRQLEQVLMNLALNARDAMPNGGLVSIRTREVVVSATDSTNVPAGRWLILSVHDTGVGMDEATRARIFEPMFTTKGPGEGTGLGMATVYGIVTQSGGHITVESELGRGTDVSIFLPVVEGLEAGRNPSTIETAVPRQARLMLVEDVLAVRRVLARGLETSGFIVVEAESAEQALELLETELEQIDALVSDIVMPGRSGIDLAEHVLAKRPRLPLLLISGDLRGHNLTRLPSSVRALQKPFTVTQLAEELGQMLTSPTSPPL